VFTIYFFLVYTNLAILSLQICALYCKALMLLTFSANSEWMEDSAKQTLKSIPLLKKNAGPRDGDMWLDRLQEEYQTIIKLIESNKEKDADWFRIEANDDGTRWFGKCWHYQNMAK
jgi:hypothetical protein